jgi:translation elongation factor EF-G
VRLGRIAHAVDHVHNCIQARIISDRIVAAGDVVVDRAGNADAGHAAQRKVARAAERTVAADDDDAVDVVLLAALDRLLKSRFLFEFKTPGGVQDRTAAMDDVGNGRLVKGFVPLAEMFGYATDLRSKTQGRGNYSMFFDHYDPVPKSVMEKLLKDK